MSRKPSIVPDSVRREERTASEAIEAFREMSAHMERGELPPGTRVTTMEMLPDGTIERTSKVVES